MLPSKFKFYASYFKHAFLSDPSYIAFSYMMFMVFGVNAIVPALYTVVVLVANLDAGTSETDEELLSLQFKRKDESIASVSITVPVNNELVKKEGVYELLFREHDSRLIKALSVQDAIESAKLTDVERLDFVGAERLS